MNVFPSPPARGLIESHPVKILLTNDDGIGAPGLEALAQALHPAFEIAVVAPAREMSAISQAVTFRKPLSVRPVASPHPAFAVDGTPVDCVKLALLALLPWKPDLVLAGINRGINVGHDVLYSGTVGGALEGAMHGAPAMAVSHDAFGKRDYRPAARFVRALLERLAPDLPPPGIVLNVNLPDRDPSDYAGIRWTRQIGVLFRDAYAEVEAEVGARAFSLDGDMKPAGELHPESDGRAVKEGFVSVTPLGFELTARDVSAAFRARLPSLDDLLEE